MTGIFADQYIVLYVFDYCGTGSTNYVWTACNGRDSVCSSVSIFITGSGQYSAAMGAHAGCFLKLLQENINGLGKKIGVCNRVQDFDY